MIKLILKLLNKTKYLYYVGRHDVLPPPLNAFEEKEALEYLTSEYSKSPSVSDIVNKQYKKVHRFKFYINNK